MSEENVSQMRKAIEAVNRRDIEGALRQLDPAVRFEHRLAALHGEFVGIDGVRGWFEDLFEHFGDSHIECSDVRDLGDRVLALGTITSTGKESEVVTELPFTVVAEYRNGRVTHFVDFGDKRHALEAVGLSE